MTKVKNEIKKIEILETAAKHKQLHLLKDYEKIWKKIKSENTNLEKEYTSLKKLIFNSKKKERSSNANFLNKHYLHYVLHKQILKEKLKPVQNHLNIASRELIANIMKTKILGQIKEQKFEKIDILETNIQDQEQEEFAVAKEIQSSLRLKKPNSEKESFLAEKNNTQNLSSQIRTWRSGQEEGMQLTYEAKNNSSYDLKLVAQNKSLDVHVNVSSNQDYFYLKRERRRILSMLRSKGYTQANLILNFQ